MLENTDTSQKSSDKYFRRLKEMTPAERLRAGLALCAAGHATQRAALRRQYPVATEDEITFRIAVSQWGPELARRVYRKRD
jgi:hypothetical protein